MPRSFIIIITILATALAFGFFLTWPKYQDFRQISLELEQKKAELESKTAYYAEVKDIWSKLEGYDDALAKIDLAVTKTYSAPVLLNYFQQTTNETGLLLENLTLGSVAAIGKVKEISFNLGASGSYSAFKSFLSALENSERLFKVKSIKLSSPEKEEGPSFNLDISTYSY